MDIVLADAHGAIMGRDQPSPNLSLLYLASYLRRDNPLVRLHYLSQKPPPERHLQLLADTQAAIYAISFTSYSAAGAYELVRAVKARFPQVTVVIGGHHVLTHPEQALRRSGADVCVIGEGEVTFAEIVRHHHRLPAALAGIEGVAYLQDGKFRRTAPRALIDDIDDIPFPSRDLMSPGDFVGISYSMRRPNTEAVITRGCPLRCVFCSNPVFRLKNGPLFRARSPQNIAREVEELYALGYREIYFHSDELNVRLDWAIDVCKALAALGHRDLYFQCNLRAEPMSEELALWMKRANFWLVRLGVESASDRVLRGIKKRMSRSKTEYACEVLARQGVKVFAFLMLFNFWEEDGRLEHETVDEVRQTLRLVYRLWFQRKLHLCGWQPAVPVPGAEFFDIAVRHGMIDDDYLPDDRWNPYPFLRGVTKGQVDAVFRAARVQTALMAATSGRIEWRNWRVITRKARSILSGLSKTAGEVVLEREDRVELVGNPDACEPENASTGGR